MEFRAGTVAVYSKLAEFSSGRGRFTDLRYSAPVSIPPPKQPFSNFEGDCEARQCHDGIRCRRGACAAGSDSMGWYAISRSNWLAPTADRTQVTGIIFRDCQRGHPLHWVYGATVPSRAAGGTGVTRNDAGSVYAVSFGGSEIRMFIRNPSNRESLRSNWMESRVVTSTYIARKKSGRPDTTFSRSDAWPATRAKRSLREEKRAPPPIDMLIAVGRSDRALKKGVRTIN